MSSWELEDGTTVPWDDADHRAFRMVIDRPQIHLTKQEMSDLLEFAEDHLEHFDAIPMEYETRDGLELSYDVIWDICKYLLPNPER